MLVTAQIILNLVSQTAAVCLASTYFHGIVNKT